MNGKSSLEQDWYCGFVKCHLLSGKITNVELYQLIKHCLSQKKFPQSEFGFITKLFVLELTLHLYKQFSHPHLRMQYLTTTTKKKKTHTHN